jgi:hypothetical protein
MPPQRRDPCDRFGPTSMAGYGMATSNMFGFCLYVNPGAQIVATGADEGVSDLWT